VFKPRPQPETVASTCRVTHAQYDNGCVETHAPKCADQLRREWELVLGHVDGDLYLHRAVPFTDVLAARDRRRHWLESVLRAHSGGPPRQRGENAVAQVLLTVLSCHRTAGHPRELSKDETQSPPMKHQMQRWPHESDTRQSAAV
jgi:hypothetical protein